MRAVNARPERRSFSSGSRFFEIDGKENFGDCLERIGLSAPLKIIVVGFLEMAMGDVGYAGAAYIRGPNPTEMVLRADRMFAPAERR